MKNGEEWHNIVSVCLEDARTTLYEKVIKRACDFYH